MLRSKPVARPWGPAALSGVNRPASMPKRTAAPSQRSARTRPQPRARTAPVRPASPSNGRNRPTSSARRGEAGDLGAGGEADGETGGGKRPADWQRPAAVGDLVAVRVFTPVPRREGDRNPGEQEGGDGEVVLGRGRLAHDQDVALEKDRD